jgi:hypothetical protein
VDWLERIGVTPERCDPTNEDVPCRPEPPTAGDLAASMAWILDLAPGAGTGYDAAGNALTAAGHESPCPVAGDECWDRVLSRAELSARYWRLLAAIHGRVPTPHRWVMPFPSRPPQRPVAS